MCGDVYQSFILVWPNMERGLLFVLNIYTPTPPSDCASPFPDMRPILAAALAFMPYGLVLVRVLYKGRGAVARASAWRSYWPWDNSTTPYGLGRNKDPGLCGDRGIKDPGLCCEGCLAGMCGFIKAGHE